MVHRKYNNLLVFGSGHNPGVTKRTCMNTGEMPHIIQVARAIVPPGEGCSHHVHDDMHELFLVEQGRGMMLVDGLETEISRRDCMAIIPGES